MGVNNDLLNAIISGLGNMPKKSEIDTPTNNIDLEATETEAGLMSAADKAKLNKISENAGKYELPVATKDTLGGVKTGSDVTDANGLTPVPIIDGIPYYSAGASEVGIPIASEDTLGGVKIGENITVSEDGTISVSDVSADKMTGILPVSKGGTGASDIHKARLNLKTACFVVTGNTTNTDASNDGYYKAFSIPSSANSKYTLRLLISSINALFDDFTVYVTLSTGDTTKDVPTGFIYSVKETHEVLNKLLIAYDSSITTGEYGFWYKNPTAKSAIRITVLQCVHSGDIVNDGYQIVSLSATPRTALATITVGIPDVVSFDDILTTKLATQSMAGYMSSEDKTKLDSMSTSVPASLESLRTDIDDAYDTISLLIKITSNSDDKGSDISYIENKETTSYQFSKPNGGTFTVSSDNTIRTYKNASSNNDGLMTSTDYDYLHGLPETLSNLQETLTNNIGAQLESHISDTSNPHQVTKEQLGLGNVENKTSAVIRSELTKGNVTKGLGYTPIKSVKYDATVTEGVKIGALTVDDSSVDLYVPSDIDTHWASNLIVGGSKTANVDAAASNGSVFMNLIENDEIRSTHKIVGNTGIRVTSDANGDITITGTTYSALKNPNALKIQINGVDNIEYDGSEEKNLDITPELIGASVSDHNHDVDYLKLSGGTLSGPLKILGMAATNPLVISGISGMNPDGTAGPLYLQYGTNSEINLGNKAAYHISADGGQYTGNSASATKLTSSAGSATQPVYFKDGKPVATTYTLAKSVPADAKFTDTIYDDSDVLAAIAAKSAVFYAECTTSRNELGKVVECEGFELKAGALIAVRFTDTTTTNPASGNFTLNINNTGAKGIGPKDNNILYKYNDGGYFCNNQTLLFTYNGTYYVHINRDANTTYTPMTLGFGYGTCTTAAATATKVVTLSNYNLIIGGIVTVLFSYDVCANAQLNINNRGAKYIYYNNTKITSGIIKGGTTATFMYNGSAYILINISDDARKVIVGSTSRTAPSNNGWYKAFELNRAINSWQAYSVRLTISPINVTNKTFTTIDVDINLYSNGSDNYIYMPHVYTSQPAHAILNDLYIVQNAPSEALSAATTWEIWYHSKSSFNAIMIEIVHINSRNKAIELWSNLNINVARTTALDSYTSGKTAYSFASVATSNLPVASTTENGLMTIDDKTKLDGIAEGANKIIVDTVLSTTSINPAANKTVTNALAQKAPNTVMSAATANADGAVGLVPAPVAGEQNKYLRGDGTWGTPEYVNTDTKVTNTLATTTKAYLTGTTSATTNTGTQVFDTGVYLDTTAGRLRATEFSENGKLLVDKYRARLSCTVGQSSPVSDPWFKVGDIIFGGAAYKNYDHMTTFRVFKPYADNGKAVGILTAHIRTTAEGAFSSGELIWEYASQEIPIDNFKLACQTGSTSFAVELWVKIPYEWQYYHFDYISAGSRTSIFNGVGWNLKSHAGDGVASITEGYKIIDATMLQLRNPIANNMYLPTAGGTMTGDISYKGSKSTFSMIRFLDNTSTAYGNGISIGGGGLTVIGGGESATTMQNTVTDFENEKMFVCNDASIDFYSNCNDGASAAKHYWMDGGRIWSERFIAQNDFCINNKVSMQYDSDAECVNFVFS